MSVAAAERLLETLLYEGYVLYPYRRSSLKNRQRWPFGALYPPAFCAAGQGDAHALQTECLVAGEDPQLRVSVRFLQLVPRADDDDDDGGSEPWHEASERRMESELLSLSELAGAPRMLSTELPCGDPRTESKPALLRGEVRISATLVARELWRLRVAVENRSTCDGALERVAVLPQVLSSTHALLVCERGRFVSLLEPPTELAAYVAACSNKGSWPVLVGEPGRDDVMLSSPIILYDRPRIAPESRGDFFDATEVDELLTLRVQTLTEQEREEALRTDPRARHVLDRTATLEPPALLDMHGARRVGSERRDAHLRPGAHVTIRPRPGGDVLDLALAGQAATVATIEEDFEGRLFYTVTIDCDPGRDLGVQGQPGHRFFFHCDELEPAP